MDKIISSTEINMWNGKKVSVVFENSNTELYKIIMGLEKYKFELLKRKLLDEYKISEEIIQKIDDVVEDLTAESYSKGMADGKDDF